MNDYSQFFGVKVNDPLKKKKISLASKVTQARAQQLAAEKPAGILDLVESALETMISVVFCLAFLIMYEQGDNGFRMFQGRATKARL